ncbi:hypothetical protein HYS50_03385 [Candidatus Woesearchaeota archaeon]|nr:hypothetical protein [Candidatus Woesearchaeota archaeon]
MAYKERLYYIVSKDHLSEIGSEDGMTEDEAIKILNETTAEELQDLVVIRGRPVKVRTSVTIVNRLDDD